MYIVLVILVYAALDNVSFKMNGKGMLNFPIKLIIALIIPLLLIGLFVFIFTVFVVAVAILFVLGMFFILFGRHKRGMKRARVVKVK